MNRDFLKRVNIENVKQYYKFLKNLEREMSDEEKTKMKKAPQFLQNKETLIRARVKETFQLFLEKLREKGLHEEKIQEKIHKAKKQENFFSLAEWENLLMMKRIAEEYKFQFHIYKGIETTENFLKGYYTLSKEEYKKAV